MTNQEPRMVNLDELIDKLVKFRDSLNAQIGPEKREGYTIYPFAHLHLVHTETGDHYPVDLCIRDVILDVSPYGEADGLALHPILLVYEAGAVNTDLINDANIRAGG